MLTRQRRSDQPSGHLPNCRLVGREISVPCVDGVERAYIDLDSAASTPVLKAVAEVVDSFLPWYSSVHRGTGYKSRIATAALEGAREAVAQFVGARADDCVIFVRNATEALNLLSAVLPEGSRILSSPVEHHANMLPWRRHRVELLPFTASPEELVEEVRHALEAAQGAIDILAVTGASNVTGEVWPIERLAALAHQAGACIVVDGAQLVPHRPIDISRLGVDLIAFSGHKLYAPFGAGALVGRSDFLHDREPLLRGGGAVEFVTEGHVTWKGIPDVHEAGSPNVVGAVALGAACDALTSIGMETIAADERTLAAALRAGLDRIDGVRRLALWDERCDRLGVATIVCEGLHYETVAEILAAEHGIAVRSGCFCAHPLVTHLLGISEEEAAAIRSDVLRGDRERMPGAVRASLGIATTRDEIEYFLSALETVVARGRSAEERLTGCDARRPLVAWPETRFRMRCDTDGVWLPRRSSTAPGDLE